MKRTTILLITLIVMVSALFAEVKNSAEFVYSFVDIGAGARATAMGDAFTAIADDSSATYWNAAGLGLIKTPQVSLSYNKWFMDSSYQYIMGAIPAGIGAIGVNIFYMNFGNFEQRDEMGINLENDINSFEVTGSLGYGAKIFENIYVGVTAKIVSQNIGDYNDIGYGIDVGGLYKNEIFSAGIKLQNFGDNGNFNLPVSIRGGVCVSAVKTESHQLLVAADSSYVFRDTVYIDMGLEYNYSETLMVRTGYKFTTEENYLDDLAGFRAGVGMRFDQFSIDYCVAPFGELGISHNVTAGFQMQLPPEKVQKKVKKNKEDDYMYYFNKGLEFERKKENAKAIDAYKKSLRLNNKNARAWKKLGYIYYYVLKNRSSAIVCFENALKLDPSDKNTQKWIDSIK